MSGLRLLNPGIAFTMFFRGAGVGDEAERPGVEGDDAAHGKSLRSERRSSSSVCLRNSQVSRCSSRAGDASTFHDWSTASAWLRSMSGSTNFPASFERFLLMRSA